MTYADFVAGVIVGSLTLYALLGGADFGGGVWALLARGPRAEAQRTTVARAIGPIWEANHVWMVIAVVLLFTSFPLAFSVAMIALHIPITLMLIGIVMRGSAFMFEKVDPAGRGGPAGWQRVFAISSLVTPVMIGVVFGAITVPGIGYEGGAVSGGFFAPWMAPFPWAVGGFTLAIFAWLAASYLTLETDDGALTEDFRLRALWCGAAVAAIGGLLILLGLHGSEGIQQLFHHTWAGLLLVSGCLTLAGAEGALLGRRYVAARLAAASTVAFLLAGWAVRQYPYLIAGAVTIDEAAAPEVTQRIVLWILGVGAVILAPAFTYLYLTFKGRVLFPGGDSS